MGTSVGEFRVVRFGGRPILATRGGRGVRLAGLSRYGASTFKRRAFRRAMRAVTLLGVDGVFTRNERQPVEGIEIDAWVEEACEAVGRGDLECVLVWPPEMRRRRVYAHLMDGDGRAVAFAKIALSDDERRGVCNEGVALGEEWLREARHFRSPTMIAQGEMGGAWTLLSEALPESVRSVVGDGEYGEAVRAEIGGEVREASGVEVCGLGWYRRYLEGARDGPMREAVLEAGSEGGRLWRVHGDMGPGNMGVDGGRVWIFDWESWDPAGPVLGDVLGFHMGLNWRRWRDDPMMGGREISERFGLGSDVALAMAFRRSTGVVRADGIMASWASIRGSSR